MRILHTADWHFGKTLEGRDRIAEQMEFVDELIDICQREQVDLVLVAGDVYQTVNPSGEAESLFYRALGELSASGTRGVVVIAGNHDNAERINAARPLADRLGITLVGLPKDIVVSTPGASSAGASSAGASSAGASSAGASSAGASSAGASSAGDGGGQRPFVRRVDGGRGFVELEIPGCSEHAVIATVPYPSEARLSEVLSDSLDEREMQANYSQRMAEWFQDLAVHFRPDTVNLVMSHLYVNGGMESDSEVQIQIGGAYAVDPEVFPANAHYVALGHLHRPQSVKHTSVPVRYAGSPLCYSFSEAGQTKSITLIDALPGQSVSIREVPLTCGKPLVHWDATKGVAEVEQWVEEGRDANAWIDLDVHVQTGLELEEIHRLRNLHPGFVHIRPIYATSPNLDPTAAPETRDGLSTDELFRRFFKDKLGVNPDDEMVELFFGLVADTETDPAALAEDEGEPLDAEDMDTGTEASAPGQRSAKDSGEVGA